jgi:uroporphyrinogen decarboxylase
VNSLERIVETLNFRRPDRVPVIAQVFGHAASVAGVPLNEYVRDGQLLARCQLEALSRYGYDAVFSMMDASVEAEAAGCELTYREGQYPAVSRHALAAGGDWDALEVPDPGSAGRMPEMLRALQLMRRELDGEVLVVGCVMGPFTLAAQLLGMEALLFLSVDDPAGLEQLLGYATAVVTRFGREQIAAGAHLPIVFDPASSPAVIPPDFFRAQVLPFLSRVFGDFKAAGAPANWLHVAGPAAPVLPDFTDAGVDIANFDYYINADEAARLLPRMCLDGNIKSVAFVEAGAGEIGQKAEALLEAFDSRGGFMLSSGCEIPPESRPENVAALVRAARAGS